MTYKPYNKAFKRNTIQLSRFLLKEKAAKKAPTYSPVNAALSKRSLINKIRFLLSIVMTVKLKKKQQGLLKISALKLLLFMNKSVVVEQL